jgi:hypothetical protein
MNRDFIESKNTFDYFCFYFRQHSMSAEKQDKGKQIIVKSQVLRLIAKLYNTL